MKQTIGILGIVLMLSFCGAKALAQAEAAPAPKACGCARVLAQADAAPAPKANETKDEIVSQTYRLTYTLTELDGAKRIGTQHFSLTANPVKPSNNARIKLGSKVPIATASSKPENQTLTQFQYQDVGLTIYAHLKEFAAGVSLDSSVEQSSVSEEQSSVGRSDPVIRQAALDNTALLTPGKPVMLGSLDIPGSTRHLDVEVVVEVVR
jgi:hypothetical protein